MATKVTTGDVRLSYPKVWEAESFRGGEPKFRTTVLVDKQDKKTVALLKRVIREAIEEKWPDASRRPKKLNLPLRDADSADEADTLEKNPQYEGCLFFTASTGASYPPKIVDRARQDIVDRSEIYPGVYVRVNVTAFAYDVQGSRGIGFALNAIQKVRDGESFGGVVVRVDDVFDDLSEYDEEDYEDYAEDDLV